MRRHIFKGVFLATVFLLIAFQSHASYRDYFPFSIWAEKEDSAEKSDIVRVKIRDTIFNIPREYLKIPVSNKGLEQTGASIIFWYPSMKSIKTPKEGQDAIFFYMQYIEGDADIPERIERIKKNYSFEFQQTMHGLQEHKRIFTSGGTYIDDMFLNKQDGQIRGYITCNAIGKMNNPRCSYALQEDGIYYHISFNRTDLPEWQRIEAKVLSLTHQFKENGE